MYNQRWNVDQIQAKLKSIHFACSRDIRSLTRNHDDNGELNMQ